MAYEWFTKETGRDNCKTYRINDLKQQKLVAAAIHGIVQHPDYVIEILGAREKNQGNPSLFDMSIIMSYIKHNISK